MPTSATFSEIRLEIYRQEIVEAQRIVAWIALRKLGYGEADMAPYLGVTTSCIYWGAAHPFQIVKRFNGVKHYSQFKVGFLFQ